MEIPANGIRKPLSNLANPPQHRVIVSTEAGAEGVNLQAANVLGKF